MKADLTYKFYKKKQAVIVIESFLCHANTWFIGENENEMPLHYIIAQQFYSSSVRKWQCHEIDNLNARKFVSGAIRL